jgi:hypothetical protein
MIQDVKQTKQEVVNNIIEETINDLKEKLQEKIKAILDDYEDDISRYEKRETDLKSRIDFCKSHSLKEEERITRVQFDELTMVIWKWRKMHNELTEMLNDWNS